MFPLFCSPWFYHPSRTIPPLATSPYAVDFCVCLICYWDCGLFRKSCLWFIPGTPWSMPWCLVYSRCSNKGLLNEWTVAVLNQTGQNPAVDILKCWCYWLTCLGKGWVFFEDLVTFTAVRCAVSSLAVITYYKKNRYSGFQYFCTVGLLCLEINIVLSFDIYFRVSRNVTTHILYYSCSI